MATPGANSPTTRRGRGPRPIGERVPRHVLEQTAGHGPGVQVHDKGPDVVDLAAERVPEDDDHEEGHADDEPECPAVVAELGKGFPCDGEGAARAHAASAPRTRARNASSRFDAPVLVLIAAGVSRARSLPRWINAARSHRDASSM